MKLFKNILFSFGNGMECSGNANDNYAM